MAKFCQNCGSPLEAGDKFCVQCGTPVEQVKTAPEQMQAPQVQPQMPPQMQMPQMQMPPQMQNIPNYAQIPYGQQPPKKGKGGIIAAFAAGVIVAAAIAAVCVFGFGEGGFFRKDAEPQVESNAPMAAASSETDNSAAPDTPSNEPDAIKVVIDGTSVQLESDPLIVDGRTLVPARPLAEAMGYDVEWDGENKILYLIQGDVTVRVSVTSSDIVRVRGGEEEVFSGDVLPQIIGGHTYLPLRVLVEAMGATVEWDKPSRTIYIDHQQ